MKDTIKYTLFFLVFVITCAGLFTSAHKKLEKRVKAFEDANVAKTTTRETTTVSAQQQEGNTPK